MDQDNHLNKVAVIWRVSRLIAMEENDYAWHKFLLSSKTIVFSKEDTLGTVR